MTPPATYAPRRAPRALTPEARALLDRLRVGPIEWHMIHSREQPALAELVGAGLADDRRHWVTLRRAG